MGILWKRKMNVRIYFRCKQKILIIKIVSGENTDRVAAVVAQSALIVESPFGIETDILTHNGGKNTGKNWNEGVGEKIKLNTYSISCCGKISIFEKAKSFFPKSFNDAPM